MSPWVLSLFVPLSLHVLPWVLTMLIATYTKITESLKLTMNTYLTHLLFIMNMYPTIPSKLISEEIISPLKMGFSPVPSKLMNRASVYLVLQTSRNPEITSPLPTK